MPAIVAEDFEMPNIPPLAAAGPRQLKRPWPIPAGVRKAVLLMVYGRLDDPDCKPLAFIEAALLAGVKPDVMRRYLDRAEIRALLLRERRAFRAAISAGNEGALMRVRDTAENGMAVVAAVRALEQFEGEDRMRASGGASSHPGITIVIGPAGRPEQPSPVVTIEASPTIPGPWSLPEDRDREMPENNLAAKMPLFSPYSFPHER